jgi:hypothetical protein
LQSSGDFLASALSPSRYRHLGVNCAEAAASAAAAIDRLHLHDARAANRAANRAAPIEPQGDGLNELAIFVGRPARRVLGRPVPRSPPRPRSPLKMLQRPRSPVAKLFAPRGRDFLSALAEAESRDDERGRAKGGTLL